MRFFLSTWFLRVVIFLSSLEDILIDYRERGREGVRKKGRETLMWERNMDPLSLTPTTYVCALTRNIICDLSVYGVMLQPTEPHQPGPRVVLGSQENWAESTELPYAHCPYIWTPPYTSIASSSLSTSPPAWYICYQRWTYIDTSLLPQRP